MENKSKVLEIENPMIINKKLANIIGINESIVVQQLEYWISHNRDAKKEKSLQDGYYWTFNTVEEWSKEFSYWSYDTVKRILAKLRKIGILITDRFNVYKYDRTLWYRIDYAKLDEIVEEYYSKNDKKESKMACLVNSAKCTIAKVKDALKHEGNITQPIPETTKEITKETITIDSSTEEEIHMSDKIEIGTMIENKIEANTNNINTEEVINEDVNTLIAYCQETNYKLRKVDMVKLLESHNVTEIIKAINVAIGTNTFVNNEIKSYMAYLVKTIKDIKDKAKNIVNTVSNGFKGATKTLQFCNYEQRVYDYDDLERQLLGW